MKALFCFMLSITGMIVLQAQSKVSFETEAGIAWAGIDRPGDLFLVLQSGEVLKYDKQGKKIGSHSFKAPPTCFDPLDGAQSFYYIMDGNHFGNISSDMLDVTQFPLDPYFAITLFSCIPITARAACCERSRTFNRTPVFSSRKSTLTSSAESETITYITESCSTVA